MKTNHTPGPWKLKREHSAIFILGDNEPWPSAGHVARVDARRSGAKRGMAVAMHMSETDEANACLIAAAPELLAALEAVEKYPDGSLLYGWVNHQGIGKAEYDRRCEVVETVRAAIAKAKEAA